MSVKIISADKAFQVAYKTYGKGDETLVVFHGFGHVKEELEFLNQHLSTKFRVIAVDVPGHGESKLAQNQNFVNPISKEQWKEIMVKMLGNENIKVFHLVGYSLGGRMALLTAEMMKSNVKSLTLFSPDGLHKSPWYRFGNDTLLGRKLLKLALNNVRISVWIIRLMNRLHLIPSEKAKFVLYQLEDKQRLSMVSAVWGALRLCWPNLDQVFSERDFQTVVLFGKKDPIIKPTFRKYLSKFEGERVMVLTAPLGHRTLKKEGIIFLQHLNYWPPSISVPAEPV